MSRGVALSLELTEVLGAVQAARTLVDLVASNHDIAEFDQGHVEFAARAVLHHVEERVDKLVCVIRDVRVLDKLSRISQRGADGNDLGGETPWMDIAGYGLLGWEKDDAETP